MKKIALIVLGIVLLGGIGFALWWVNEREREVDIPKESFIPYNSAVVINVNANANLSPKIATAFDREIKAFRKSMLSRVVDTLKQVSQVDTSSYVMAIRVEGKQSIRFLYVLNRSGLFSRGDVHVFLQKMFAGVQVKNIIIKRYTWRVGERMRCVTLLSVVWYWFLTPSYTWRMP